MVLTLLPARQTSTRKRWQPGDYERILADKEGGKSMRQIADDMGRTYESVVQFLRAKRGHGAFQRGLMFTEERVCLMRQLWPQDIPAAEVMRRINELPGSPISNPKTLRGLARVAEVKRFADYRKAATPVRGTWTDERIALFRQLRAENVGREVILERVNALPGPKISCADRLTDAARRLGIPSAVRQPKAGRKSRAKAPGEAKAAKRERAEPTPLRFKPSQPSAGWVEPRYAGWIEISNWWFEQTGKREWRPDLNAVNALRRKKGRAPYAIVGGKWTAKVAA